MNVALRKPRMTREEFFPWAEAQDARYEFDGFEPVAMTGGNVRHNQMIWNLHRALESRLPPGCRALGPDAGLRTVGEAVRYPDALITCARVDDSAREVPGVVVVFEVLSPTSGHTDRVVKLREYRAVASLRRYIIADHASISVTVHARATEGEDWTTTVLTADEMLDLREVGISVPVAEFYARTALAANGEPSA